MFEVSFHDELSTDGYKTFTQDFLQQRGADNSVLTDPKLTSALVELR